MVTNPLFFPYTPSEVEIETRRRIRLAVAAYAYEFENDSIMTDAEFDDEAKTVNLSVRTQRHDLDEWFIKNFTPHTGSWIHQHPELDKIKHIYQTCYKNRKKG